MCRLLRLATERIIGRLRRIILSISQLPEGWRVNIGGCGIAILGLLQLISVAATLFWQKLLLFGAAVLLIAAVELWIVKHLLNIDVRRWMRYFRRPAL